MMKGYIDAYLALGEENYLQAALTNARFLEEIMIRDKGRLWRNYKDGKAGIEAFLDDYGLLPMLMFNYTKLLWMYIG